MTQEDKELLLKDLCVRLPYEVKVSTIDEDGSLENVWDILWYNTFTADVKLTHSIEDANKIIDIFEIKPYLFPLSSMTEEQKRECFKEPIPIELDEYFEIWSKISSDTYTIVSNMIDWLKVIDYLNKNHFDYRGLIQKGLAIDCTNLNIY